MRLGVYRSEWTGEHIKRGKRTAEVERQGEASDLGGGSTGRRERERSVSPASSSSWVSSTCGRSKHGREPCRRAYSARGDAREQILSLIHI